MPMPSSAQKDLRTVVELMSELSRQTDPQAAAELYAQGLRKLNLIPNDRYLSLSRRDLQSPEYRITRCSTWTKHPNPWNEREKLPLFSGGLLADILYSNEPAVIDNLQSRLSPTDPAHEYLHDINLLVALPHFDNGQSINAGILLCKNCDTFPFDQIPLMLWQANLWGRATLNLVTRQKLNTAYQSIDRELKIVGDIQKSLLPRTLPEIPAIDIAAHYQTSQRAGGDYYDFFALPDNKWGIFIADVSGHGTPAAVMMAITHAIAHSNPDHPAAPADVLQYLNHKLTHRYTQDTGTFITALYALLDPATRTLTLSSAGHPLPRLIRNNIPIEISCETSLPLGITLDETFQEHAVMLRPYDKLLFYTDGITESFNPAGAGGGGDLYGISRLDAACCHTPDSATAFIRSILANVNAFTGNTPSSDDRTLLALLFN
jgi:sigma-B regulation protein RsbU (phosphoserine phosphatase)